MYMIPCVCVWVCVCARVCVRVYIYIYMQIYLPKAHVKNTIMQLFATRFTPLLPMIQPRQENWQRPSSAATTWCRPVWVEFPSPERPWKHLKLRVIHRPRRWIEFALLFSFNERVIYSRLVSQQMAALLLVKANDFHAIRWGLPCTWLYVFLFHSPALYLEHH